MILGCLSFIADAQVNRYAVTFSDKVGTPYTVGNPEAFLSMRAIARRSTQNINVTEVDLPVTPDYVAGVTAAGANVLLRTRWMNGVLIECSSAVAATVMGLPFVNDVELVAVGARPNAREGNSGGRKASRSSADATEAQLAMLGIDVMHADGYTGNNVYVAVFDGGFDGVDAVDFFDDLRTDNRILYTEDLVYGGTDVYRHDDHGTGVFSAMAAYKTDEYTGGAVEASYVLFVSEDVATEYRIEEYNWLIAAEKADSAGVDIINASVGYNTFDDPSMDYTPAQMDGETALVSQAATLAAERGIVVVCSAGNSGSSAWQIITAPADAEGILAVGNVNLSGIKSPSSSIGPSADGRIKPDVVALGTGVAVIRASGEIQNRNGTSFASPLIASLAAGLRQRFPNVTTTMLTQAIRMSASQATTPDNQLGYGIPSYITAVELLASEEQEEDLAVFPNPVSDTLYVVPRTPQEIPRASVALVTLTGQTLAQYDLAFSDAANRWKLPMQHYPAGVYLVRIKTGDRWRVFKIVKV